MKVSIIINHYKNSVTLPQYAIYCGYLRINCHICICKNGGATILILDFNILKSKISLFQLELPPLTLPTPILSNPLQPTNQDQIGIMYTKSPSTPSSLLSYSLSFPSSRQGYGGVDWEETMKLLVSDEVARSFLMMSSHLN